MQIWLVASMPFETFAAQCYHHLILRPNMAVCSYPTYRPEMRAFTDKLMSLEAVLLAHGHSLPLASLPLTFHWLSRFQAVTALANSNEGRAPLGDACSSNAATAE